MNAVAATASTLLARARASLSLVVAGTALAAFLVAILAYRMRGAWASEYAIDGDQGQAVWHFWRYHVDGALPPGHLLTDWAFAYFGPLLYRLIMAVMCQVFQPLMAAKLLQVVTFITLTVAAVYVVGKRTHWLLGIAVGFLVLRSPDLASTMAGGIPRSFGPTLFLAFVAAFLAQRHTLCLVILVVQSGLYPSVVIPCGITYGVYCLVAGPTMKDRLRRCAGMFVAGLLVIAMGKYQDWQAPDWWGDIVTYEEAEKMPAWRAGGRFPDVPHKPAEVLITRNLVRGLQPLGHTLAPKSAQEFVNRHVNATLVYTPLALATVAIVVDRARRRRQGLPPPDVDARVPWQIFAVLAGSLAAYVFVRIVAFKLFLPSRQLGHTLQYIVMTGLPIIAWCAARALVGERKNRALAIAIALSVLPTFFFRGDGLALSPYRYTNAYARERPVWERVRTLPLEANIACDGVWCEGVGIFGYHRAFAARNLTHPLRKGYYDEAERRLVEMHKALYATSWEDVVAFAEREDIDYFLYNVDRVTTPQPNIYQPAKKRIHAAHKAATSTGRALVMANPPKEAVIFERGKTRLLYMKKLKELVAAGAVTDPAAPAVPTVDVAPAETRDDDAHIEGETARDE